MQKRHAEELRQIDNELASPRRKLANLENRCRVIIDAADSYLAATADPKIREFQKELEKRRSSLLPETQSGTSVEGRSIITHSTYESWQAAVNRINEIICSDAKALALLPLTEAELETALEDLRRSIPEIRMEKIR
jgi:hypothetical protein